MERDIADRLGAARGSAGRGICTPAGGAYRAGFTEGIGDQPINLAYLYPKAAIAAKPDEVQFGAIQL